MCGIAGVTFWNLPSGEPDPYARVSAMVNALAHRGPDGHGCARCDETASRTGHATVLGHTRLAILDLSDRGAQPMKSPRGPFWISFNGEIYNFLEIRAELARCGRRFHSHTDTEVILQGYEEWGEGVVDRLRGMFAFAIWDGRRHEVVLVRDRLGIKPLYLYKLPGGVVFASEVWALLASGLVPRVIDPIAVDQFLAYQTVPPPRTLVAGVEMVRPGRIVRIDVVSGAMAERRYWDALDSASKDAVGANADEARERVRRLLHE